MKHVKTFIMLAAVALLAAACSNDDEPEYYQLRAGDGRTITVASAVQHYNTESDFASALAAVQLFDNAGAATKAASDVTAERATVYGYDSEPYLLNEVWQRVRFGGTWCERYGFTAGQTYLLNYQRITKYIPSTYVQTLAKDSYLPTDRNMGYYNGAVGYLLESENVAGYQTAYTLLAVIGYDAEGNVLNTHYPCEPSQLQWNYFVITVE